MDSDRLVMTPPGAKVGTVIVRLRDAEAPSNRCFCDIHPYPVSGYSVVPSVSAPGCEDCIRTRLSSRSSDRVCDVTRCRSCRTNVIMWRRYVNVFAAVCILLLIGGLSPQTSAAPLRPNSARMDKSKRDTWSHKEILLWSNPCDYKNVNDIPVLEYSPNRASNIAQLARHVKEKAVAYSNDFADKIHSYKNFELLLREWESSEWLRSFSWFTHKLLPEEKKFNSLLSDEDIEHLLETKDNWLPGLYKALKMVVAALYTMQREGLNDQPSPALKEKVHQTMHDVRGVLCQFNELMTSRNLQILEIDLSEIPRFDKSTMDKDVLLLLVYRDMLNLLEYMGQVFQKMSEESVKT